MNKVSKRTIQDMAEMYGLPKELYTMKRGIKYKNDLRYDITIIPPLIINGQYNKTKGHKHPYEEYYEVLEGKAYFLFQNTKGECILEERKKGESIIVPKNWYHITINPGKKVLKLGNWVLTDGISNYKYIEKMKGMRFFITTDGLKTNPQYRVDK